MQKMKVFGREIAKVGDVGLGTARNAEFILEYDEFEATKEHLKEHAKRVISDV